MNESENKKAGRLRARRILTTVLAVLLTAVIIALAVLFVLFRDHLSLDAIKRRLNYRALSTTSGQTEAFSYAGGKNCSYALLNGSVLVCSSSGIRLYGADGTDLWEESLNMDSPVLCQCGDYAAVYDAGGQEIREYDNSGQLQSYTLDSGFGCFSARPNSSGWLAVTAQSAGYKGGVTVYNSGGSKVIELDYSSAFVVDASVSDDCKTVAIVTLDGGSGSFQSSLLIYQVDSSEPENTVSLGNTEILELGRDSNTIRALGESGLTLLDKDGTSSGAYDFSDRFLKAYSLSGDDFSILLLGKYRAGSANQVVSIGDDGDVLGDLTVSSQVLSLSSAGKYFAVLTGNRLDIYTSSCQLYASLTDTKSAKYVRMNSDGSALLISTDSVWLFIPD